MTTENSLPYTIATVPSLKNGWGRLGIAACPGVRRGAVDGTAAGTGAALLLSDLEAIKDWGASAVLTFMESQELERLGVGALPDRVRDLAMDWYHLPIADFGAPPPQTQERWWQLLPDFRQRLAAGQSLFFHCRGGQGRSGMMLAKLLVVEGLSPADAMAQVRAVRRGAIETSGQEAWIGEAGNED